MPGSRATQLLCLAIVAGVPGWCVAADDPGRVSRVSFTDGKKLRTVVGRVLVTAQDGGLLVEGRDGRLWTVTPERLKKHEPTDEKFTPLSKAELGKQLQEELGDGFELVTTRHYVVLSEAGRRYGIWCGALFERLQKAFYGHWKARKLPLAPPTFPLVAVVLKDQQRFIEFARKDTDIDPTNSVGYFSIMSNRMVLFDLAATPGEPSPKTSIEINRRVRLVPQSVATLVHEATHQLAFNSGLSRRLADNPMWLTEGLAVYFEAPDLRSRTGWRTAGRLHPLRLARFKQYVLEHRGPGSLKSLVAGDARFRDVTAATDAYAEAWALSFYLIRARRKDYVEYLKRIAAKPLLKWDTAESRIADFEAVFGDNWELLDRRFLGYIGRQRIRRR